MTRSEKLMSIGSLPLGGELPLRNSLPDLPWLDRVMDLLRLKNGFYAFESALHVFPLGKQPGVMDLESWNAQDLWRHQYGNLLDGLLCFAEDIVGCQFCIGEEGISLFNPEDGSIEPTADTIEGWADALLGDYEVLTGYPWARDWQRIHGPLPEGHRLRFQMPLILKGKTEISNMAEFDALEVMLSSANVWKQIKDVPPGTPFTVKYVD